MFNGTAPAGEQQAEGGAAGGAGWGGITARLQRLRAELQVTHARLHIVAQVGGVAGPWLAGIEGHWDDYEPREMPAC